MADDNRNDRKISKSIDSISNSIDNLYQTQYSTRTDNKANMNSIVNGINDEINDIISRVNGTDVNKISDLYVRLLNKKGTDIAGASKELHDSLEDFMEDGQIMNNIMNFDTIRKSIQAQDYQYDLICKYMTKLEDAIEIKKDNVLSSDNFTKDFVNITSSRCGEEYMSTFNDRALLLKDKYNIQELFEDMYYKTSKYGEYFLYCVPFHKAFKRLLDRKARLNQGIHYEQATLLETSDIVKEDNIKMLLENSETQLTEEEKKKFANCLRETFGDKHDFKVNLIFDESGIVPEAISHVEECNRILNEQTSLTESFYESVNNTEEGDEAVSELAWGDGLFTSDGKTDGDKVDKDITGTVLTELERENIIPVYMDKTCLGYFYLMVENDWVQEIVMNGNTYNSLTNNTRLLADDFDRQNDVLVSQIASMMSDKITSKFINANVDLKDEIYAVLRYNDHFNTTHGTNNITVTFLPVEDVHHFYFKLDDKTHRGISDLQKALVPAMIYCMLYLNTAIATMGRASDKRIYYVKQNVEQNVARTMLNVITQLKKGNMGMRQLTNLNTIFNVIGKFNDHVIPVSQSGDHPIDFEVMQGQTVETPTDMMDRMEDMAVSSTDVPLEFIQSVNSVDYATRFTMSNSKFLRKVYKRQSICQKHFTQIFRKIYNFEYKENDMSVKILLPAPAYLNMTNTQQLIDNAKSLTTALSDMRLATEEDEKVKQNFTMLFMQQQLGTYIDFSMVDDIIMQARLMANADKDDPDLADDGTDY